MADQGDHLRQALIVSLLAAVQTRPDDLPLRVHLARLLLDTGRRSEAVAQVARALLQAPDDPDALALMASAVGRAGAQPVPGKQADGVDWQAFEDQFADRRPPVTMVDVGGMEQVKQRLELSFLAPLRNPQLRRAFGKSLRGGLLLYGPPGCGKTFIARALAGEANARFRSLSIVDVLDMWVGGSERNLHQVFQAARREAPCVLFLDEIDAIGHKRSQLRPGGVRTLANQLLAELDGIDGDNEGVFLLAATNAPWDVDPALRRPGRFDRMVLVAPPDPAAREAILLQHLRRRPVGLIDLYRLIAATDGYSGADLAHLCESAAELALHDSIGSGTVRPIQQHDFERPLAEIRPSVGTWCATARNVALFANDGGVYDELADYLRSRKLI